MATVKRIEIILDADPNSLGDISGLDEMATLARFAALVEQRVCRLYPDAEVYVERRPLTADQVTVTLDDGSEWTRADDTPDADGSADVEAVEAAIAAVHEGGDGDYWVAAVQ